MSKMNLSRTQIALLLVLLVTFFLPVHPRILPPLMLVLFVYNFFLEGWSNRFRKVLTNMAFWFFAAFYLLCLAGMLWTSEAGQHAGWSTLETKLSLLLVPLIIWTLPLAAIPERSVLKKYFVLGVGASLLLCVLFGIYHLIDERIDMANGIHRDNFRYYWFFSDRLSIFFHPTYLSMYANLALAFVLMQPGRNLFKPLMQFVLVAFLLAGIFMLASKAGLVTMIFLVLAFVLRLIFKEKKIKLAFSGIAALLLLFAGAYFGIKEFRQKISMAVLAVRGTETTQTSHESSAMRVEIWKTALDVSRQHLPFGCGTGDSRTELLKAYQQRGLDAELKLHLNAHNQFLEVCIGIGIPGLLVLLGWYLQGQFYFLRFRDFDGAWIMLIFLLNNLVECMLETQAGTIFFAFFVPIFMRYCISEKQKN